MKATGYQAIRTRYHGPTNFRGSRIIARAEAGSVVVGYDYALDIADNHAAAAEALADKFEWHRPGYTWVGGVFDHDYYWVHSKEVTNT